MRKINKVIVLFVLLLMLLTNSVSAMNLNLEMKVSEEKIKTGDEVTVTVNWQEKMQAADFSLFYDSEKLEYLSSDVDEMFTKKGDNKISVFWFSTDNTDKTKIEFKFKAIKEGKAELTTKIEGGFATGELEQPDEYEEGKATIKIKNSNSPIFIIIMILIIIFFILILKTKIQRRKKNGKIKKG